MKIESKLVEHIKIESQNQLFRVVQNLNELIAEESIEQVRGNCKIAEIKPGDPMPVPEVELEFLELLTQFRFRLTCNSVDGIQGLFERIK